MGSEEGSRFPTFECIISNTQEDMDSEVENFFLKKNEVAVLLARLKKSDSGWAENYDRMMNYLQDISDSIVEFGNPASHQFLVELCMGEELEYGDTVGMLRKSGNSIVYDLAEAGIRVREMIYWYVRNSKNSKFSRSFTPDRFQGLPFLRLALVYRGVSLVNSENGK